MNDYKKLFYISDVYRLELQQGRNDRCFTCIDRLAEDSYKLRS